MDKKLTNQALWFLLALAFPLVAIAAGLQSCSDDGPAIPSSDSVEKEGQVKNPLMRSPEEAIAIAQRAWEEFYGDEAGTASRSGRRCVIDYGRPVEVIRGAKSRGVAGSDTLLYVVNFADDGGFAVIAAPRHADELLAVTSQGHYYPESQPDQEKVPGFELWMENAQAYAASFGLLSDSVKWYLLDTTHNGGLDSCLIKPVNPPITRDTTKNIDPNRPNPDPNDPYSGLLQQKELEDTIYDFKTDPQVRYSWGQGGHNTTNLANSNCEYPNEGAHAWVCDGNRHVSYYHYYATRENSSQQWKIQSCEQGRSDMFHYNWGWNGRYNGWFSSLRLVLNSTDKLGFQNLRYLRIVKPQ